ncbi:MAG: hypothetical protein Alis3KO_08820 [Aliiglaciecola sp.]
MNKEKENWSQYWQKESAKGEVFVNKDGDKHQGLRDFWRSKLDNLPAGSRIIDLACGAGSIYADLENAANFNLFAADYSQSALEQLVKRMPDVNIKVCSANDLPYEDNMFDGVVSQFGIEYAGVSAFVEAARVLKSKKTLVVLCHFQEGFIDSKNKQELEGAKLVETLNFIPIAKKVTNAFYEAKESVIKQAMTEFTSVEPELAKKVAVATSGVHVHLYNGFKQLFMNRQAYAKEDIIGWLDAMSDEVSTAILRLTDMRNAALSEQQMIDVCDQVAANYAGEPKFSSFTLSGHELPVAWHFEYTKP